MTARPTYLAPALALLIGCSGDPEGPLPTTADGTLVATAIAFQAVDAGTGGPLTDADLTVRYLVREPVTLVAYGTERVPSAEPYRIEERVGSEALVVEVRLEAPSYFRLDTVLSAARGQSAGPLTVRMARRLERAAAGAGSGTPARRPAAGGASRPAAPPPDPDAGVDRSALEEGDRLFRAGNWLDAVDAYRRMTPPTGRGAYARAYQEGLVNQGISHLRVSEMGAAMEVLESALDLGLPNYRAWRFLAHVQCAVGRVEDGLDSLDELEDMAGSIPAGERPEALAFAKYEEGLCRKRTFDRTEGTLNLVGAGRRVVTALEEFVGLAEAVSSPSAELRSAVEEANGIIEEVRARMRRGG